MTTLAEAQAMVTAYLSAEQAILQGKEVRLGGAGLDRWLRQEDLDMVRAGRQEWERRVVALQAANDRRPSFGGLGYSVADFSQPQPR
jgi:hypothetical protein